MKNDDQGGSVLQRLRAAGARPAEASRDTRPVLARLRSDHVEDARDLEDAQRLEGTHDIGCDMGCDCTCGVAVSQEAADRLGHARKFTEEDKQLARNARAANRTDSSGKHEVLDERHAAEQDAIGGGRRFGSGEYLVEILGCYAVDGDPEIWLPETGVGYFVAECSIVGIDRFSIDAHEQLSQVPGYVGFWVNRLRFGGPQQLKAFLLEALGLPAAQHGLITGAKCAEVVSAVNPLAGKRLRLTVQPPTRSGYMHHRWVRVG